MKAFEGTRVLVTGASMGIGQATSVAFARGGARVAVHYHRHEAGAAATLRAVVDAQGTARAFCADLSNWNAARALIDDVWTAFGGLDVVVANHGIWKRAPIDEMSESDYEEMFGTNVRGVFALLGRATERMRNAGQTGAFVLVSSTAGQRGEAHHAHYAATKGAIISLTKSLAAELAPSGIRVNCVAPGWVQTSMTAATLADPVQAARVLASIPMARVATPEEIAEVVLFLANPASAFVNGEILNANGAAVLVG